MPCPVCGSYHYPGNTISISRDYGDYVLWDIYHAECREATENPDRKGELLEAIHE